MFNLKSDHYTLSLCKVFDSDNSGKIGFRECVVRRLRSVAYSSLTPRPGAQVCVQPGEVQRQLVRRVPRASASRQSG